MRSLVAEVLPFPRLVGGLSGPRGRRWPGVVVAAVIASGLAACGSGSPSKGDAQATTVSTVSADAPAKFGALPTEQLGAATSKRLQAVLDARIEQGDPDVIAAVLTPQGVWAGAAGVAGPKKRLATTRDEFAIASISKPFTAALIMRLVEQGKIGLDQPLSKYLGSPTPQTNGATVRQALAMQSGIPQTTDESSAKVLGDPARVWTSPEIVAEFPKPTTKAGTGFIYSNPTYKLLDLAAEHVTGMALPTAMRTEVLDPANSPSTLLVQSAQQHTPKPWALPTRFDDMDLDSYGTGGALPTISDATFSLAASGMASDAPSLAEWAWQLFAGNVVSTSSLATMATADANGNGLGLDRLFGGALGGAYGFEGNKTGYQSTLAILPNKQTVIVVFVNQRDADTSGIAALLLAATEA